MGSQITLNDTLQITSEQGFPDILNLEKPPKLEEVQNQIFSFQNKPGARIYHQPPTRCFLVHNVKGKWLYWGKIMMLEQTINSETKTTSGKFRIIQIYDKEYQKQITKNESPEGLNYEF